MPARNRAGYMRITRKESSYRLPISATDRPALPVPPGGSTPNSYSTSTPVPAPTVPEAPTPTLLIVVTIVVAAAVILRTRRGGS
jgi:hypothetical protein